MRNFIIGAQFSFGGLDPFYEIPRFRKEMQKIDGLRLVLFSVLYLYPCARIFDYVATSIGCSFTTSHISGMKMKHLFFDTVCYV